MCVCVCVCVHECESALVCLYLGVFVCTWSLGWAGACLGALCPSALCVTQCICPGVSMSPCVQTPAKAGETGPSPGLGRFHMPQRS